MIEILLLVGSIASAIGAIYKYVLMPFYQAIEYAREIRDSLEEQKELNQQFARFSERTEDRLNELERVVLVDRREEGAW